MTIVPAAPCCGDAYEAAPNRLGVSLCPEHGQHCVHWRAVWAQRASLGD
jgi:hypothetical protein